MHLSASPSRAIPKSALFLFTTEANLVVLVEPPFLFTLVPSGLTFMGITSAPNSHKIVGPILYAAPLAQSITIFKPSNLNEDDILDF